MAKYHFTRKAIEDLNGIWHYTANVWSEEQADFYYNQKINCMPAQGKVIFDGKEYIFNKEDSFGNFI